MTAVHLTLCWINLNACVRINGAGIIANGLHSPEELVTSRILGKLAVSRLVNVPHGKVNKANPKHTSQRLWSLAHQGRPYLVTRQLTDSVQSVTNSLTFYSRMEQVFKPNPLLLFIKIVEAKNNTLPLFFSKTFRASRLAVARTKQQKTYHYSNH